ncbi:MAG: ABC transporter permease [Candidatus Woesearchaeota archaeon]
MIKEYFKIAFKSLKRRKMRTFLTLLGIVIGIAAVISLVSLGQGLQDAIDQQFETIGSDKIFIQPKSAMGIMTMGQVQNPLTTKDEDFLESISGVKAVSGYSMISGKIEFQGTIKYFLVVSVPQDTGKLKLVIDMMGIEYIQGRPLQPNDKQSATIGYHFYTQGLFNNRNIFVGDRIIINNKKFSVVGIHEPIGNPEDDRMILIGESQFREIFDMPDRVDAIVVQVEKDKDLRAMADLINKELARHRDVKIGKEDFLLNTPEDILDSLSTVLNIVQAVFIGIALVSLFVGSVGITNTMYTSVLERRKDIGIMKAIGAKNSDIFQLFLIESGMLGLVGGIIGVIIGIMLAKSVEIVSTMALGKSFLIAHLSWELILGALLFAFILGSLVGSLPARSASKLQAVDTLRDE